MITIKDLQKAFITKLQALYDVEKQLEKALPIMRKAATDKNLKDAFESHLIETKTHSIRLEKMFKMLNMAPKKLKSEGIRGIIADGKWVSKVKAPANIKNSMVASAARYAEHYEMSGYMSAIEQAEAMGFIEAVALLTETLKEERLADVKLAAVMEENLELEETKKNKKEE